VHNFYSILASIHMTYMAKWLLFMLNAHTAHLTRLNLSNLTQHNLSPNWGLYPVLLIYFDTVNTNLLITVMTTNSCIFKLMFL